VVVTVRTKPTRAGDSATHPVDRTAIAELNRRKVQNSAETTAATGPREKALHPVKTAALEVRKRHRRGVDVAARTDKDAAPLAAAAVRKKAARTDKDAAPVAAGPVRKKTPIAVAATARAIETTAAVKSARKHIAVSIDVAPRIETATAPVAAKPVRTKTPRVETATAPVAAKPVRTTTARSVPAAGAAGAARKEAPPAAIPPAERASAPVDAVNHPRPSISDGTGELPPPPVAVIHRRSRAGETDPESRPRKRGPLGGDALAELGTARTLRSAIDHVVGDLAEQRDRAKR
jgi:hypothetical protein